ncbi:MAG: carboxymuconolactone decarboxylase family protein, partial [Phycisphaerales bacterium]|nr:carboxymuconolactone decarboxylase family protein [Phycisphaerales bacterium]
MTETLPMTSPVRYDVESPEIFKAMIAASQTITEGDLDPLLKHLVKLRASQINGCVFCIDMHLREARHDGETNDRLDKLV